MTNMRIERDCLGEMETPNDRYYGIQTIRNMKVSGAAGFPVVAYPDMHKALCQIKKACAKANAEIGAMKPEIAQAISEACGKVLADAFDAKAKAFEHIVKVGRTCWQDALPVTLGQEFSGFASAIRRQARALKALRPGCFELIMGGNAVGTGLGAQPGYMDAFYKAISAELGESVRPNPNLFDGFQNSDFILTVSGAVKTIAATLSKICKDLRLMSSGPRAGWMEINLPACAPGSSIMPGKINPTVPEMVIQIGHQVCGNDVAITMAIDEGELDLNVWDATFYKCLFENLQLVGEEIVILRRDCVEGITANEFRCKEEAESSIALSTVVAATFGYPKGVEVAHYCEKHRCNVKDAVVAMGLMTQEQAEILVDPSLMANPEKMAPIVARFKKELGILI